MEYKTVLCGLLLILATSALPAQSADGQVKIVGQMKNVMWKGQLSGIIDADTLSDKTNLYGFGPLEYLTGEILILDGRSFKSTVQNDSTMKVEESYQVKAPFFAYAHITAWQEQPMPDSIQTLVQLESYLDRLSTNLPRPFLFKLAGKVEQATIHIVNLPAGSKVNSPDKAHQGQRNYQLHNEKAEIIGFFSTEHKAIFTHHDTFLHLHLITADRQKMGHLEQALFGKATMKLYLPAF